jgi:hypothetical protein
MKTMKRFVIVITLGLMSGSFLFSFTGCTKKPPTTISGKIQIAPLLDRIPIRPSAALYLIAKRSGQGSGFPAAVKRYTPPFKFPIEFTLSARDAMMPDAPFEGPFDITVRLAQSGSATPATQGDFEGAVPSGPVPLGATDVEVRLAQVRP